MKQVTHVQNVVLSNLTAWLQESRLLLVKYSKAKQTLASKQNAQVKLVLVCSSCEWYLYR